MRQHRLALLLAESLLEVRRYGNRGPDHPERHRSRQPRPPADPDVRNPKSRNQEIEVCRFPRDAPAIASPQSPAPDCQSRQQHESHHDPCQHQGLDQTHRGQPLRLPDRSHPKSHPLLLGRATRFGRLWFRISNPDGRYTHWQSRSEPAVATPPGDLEANDPDHRQDPRLPEPTPQGCGADETRRHPDTHQHDRHFHRHQSPPRTEPHGQDEIHRALLFASRIIFSNSSSSARLTSRVVSRWFTASARLPSNSRPTKCSPALRFTSSA